MTHFDEATRLAALESILVEGLAQRRVSEQYKVGRGTLQRWLAQHYDGTVTMAMLRKRLRHQPDEGPAEKIQRSPQSSEAVELPDVESDDSDKSVLEAARLVAEVTTARDAHRAKAVERVARLKAELAAAEKHLAILARLDAVEVEP